MISVISIKHIFEWVMLTSLQVSLLIGLILLIQICLRGRLAGRWHYGLWLLVVIRLIMPGAPQSRLSLYNLTPIPSMPAIHTQTPIMDGYLTFNNLTPEQGVIAPLADAPAIDKCIERPLEDRSCSARGNPAVVQGDRWTVWAVLPAVWLGGILVLSTIIFVANLRLWLKVRREKIVTHPQALELLGDCMEQMGIAGKNPLVVVATDQVYSPSLFGSIHPRLLLPKGLLASLNASQLRHIFLHELAHLKRRDIQMGWLTTLLQIVHWFNPLVWYAFYRMRVEREIACDEMVLTALHSEQPQKYGQTIVRLLECFSQRRPLPSLVGMLESRFYLKRRIAMIANFKRNTKNGAWLTAGLMIMLACVAMTSAQDIKQPAKMELKTQGQAFVKLLTSEQYEEAAKHFDENMTQLMGGKKLAEKWQSLVAKIQPFKKQLVARLDKYQNYDVVLVTCEFKKGPVDVMLVYDGERKISGLHFLPTPLAVWNQYHPATSHKTPGRAELKSAAQEPTLISSHPNSMAPSSELPKKSGLTKRQAAEAMEVERLNPIDNNTQQRVSALMMSAKEFRGMQDYEKAAMIIDRVLEIEPRHHQAKRQKDQLKDLIFFKKQLEIAKVSDSERSKVLTDVNQSAIPVSKQYQFPEDWQEKTARRANKDQTEAKNRALDSKSLTTLTKGTDRRRPSDTMVFSYTDESLGDVINDIRTRSGLNIITMWSDLEGIDITPDDIVKVELKNISYGAVLNTVLKYVSSGKEKRAGYNVDDQGIITIEAVSKEHDYVTDLYYIADLVQQQAGMGMGGMGMSGNMGGYGMGNSQGMGGRGGYGIGNSQGMGGRGGYGGYGVGGRSSRGGYGSSSRSGYGSSGRSGYGGRSGRGGYNNGR